MTYREAINRILVVLREDQISDSLGTLTDPYQLALGQIVNIIKEEIEDAHNWRILKHTETVTVNASENTALITNTNERSRLVRVHEPLRGRLIPLVFDVTDTENPIPIREMDGAEIIHRETLDTTTTNDSPVFFTLNRSGSQLQLQVYPTPASAKNIQVTFVTPQARLGPSDLDTEILIPARVLELGSIWYALEERGEELGPDSLFSKDKYEQAKFDTISLDAQEQGEYELVPV